MADYTGQQFGNYRLVRLLGQGGFAGVYLGQHLRLNQQTAIKVLHAHLTGSEAEHFQQEAQTISTLVHPSIIRVFDYDVQDGIPFLVMDYAPNGSLRQRYPRGSTVPLPQVVSFVKQVADALQYAYEQKFIHRDVKPENMLLGRREEVLLSDFGIATIAHSSGSLSTNEAIGTLAYMAPEQIEGHPRPASDQYALAVVVYEWLCGGRPFEGSPTEVMVQQLSMPPQSLRERVPTIPSNVEQVVLRALAKDPKARFASVRNFATALEQASQHTGSSTAHIASDQSLPGSSPPEDFATVVVPLEAAPALVGSVTPPESLSDSDTPAGQNGNPVLTATTPATPFLATTPVAEEVPLLPLPARPRRRRTIAGLPAALFIGLAVLVIAGSVLGSLSLLAHFGVPGTHTNSAIIGPVQGGTWTVGSSLPPDSLIPFSGTSYGNFDLDQALYLPLFYSDGFGVIYPGAASEVPTVQNGGISADAKTWTFHMRPGLVWSDGEPYDARDVDFTWKLFLDPQFDPGNYLFGRSLFSSANVSTDHLSITFHLKRSFAPFLPAWVDGVEAPLPAHHFSTMAPGQILKSPDLLNPQITSGPFLMAESTPGNHFTMVRNHHYYLASRGLPYLDKVVFRILTQDAIKQGLQANTIDSTGDQSLDFMHLQDYRSLHGYALVTSPTSVFFEGLFFNFHNTVLANHLEVRQAISIAIDQQAVIQAIPPEEKITQQCIDHSSFYHPGFDPYAPCPVYGPAVANQLLDNNGWVKGADGVREKGGQRLEFEYSLPIIPGDPTRFSVEMIVQRDLQAIGIKLDIQNYPETIFFGSFLPAGKASPPTGALAGRYDIAEYSVTLNWDPDDEELLSCDQMPPNGGNFDFYCNPALDALYQQELATVDPGARQSIFVQIHLIYLTQFPFIVLFGSKDLYMIHTGTHNFQPSPNNITDENIAQWWCDNGKC